MTSPPDIINGLFEFIGAISIFQNVLVLHRDKQVRGVHWGSTAYFTLWGFWNLFYYPSLNQWASFAGGALIAVVNVLWLFQLYYYRRR